MRNFFKGLLSLIVSVHCLGMKLVLLRWIEVREAGVRRSHRLLNVEHSILHGVLDNLVVVAVE